MLYNVNNNYYLYQCCKPVQGRAPSLLYRSIFYSAFFSPLPSFPFRCFLPLASPFVLQLLLQCVVAKSVELIEGYRLLRSSDSQQYATKRLHVSSHSSVLPVWLLLLLLLLISAAELASQQIIVQILFLHMLFRMGKSCAQNYQYGDAFLVTSARRFKI